MQMELSHVMYAPSHGAQRGAPAATTKHRKSYSTGGGRAWSESEEQYLLQTRLQKMPYKHIAAHLNKTELACRLHYHQISHGSSRRKRNLSCSSVATDYSHLFRERSVGRDSTSRMSPASQVDGGSRASSVSPVRLPSIMSATSSPKLPAILPKPDHDMGGATQPDHHMMPRGYPEGQRMLPSFESRKQQQQLSLDTALPSMSAPSHDASHVDLSRLHAIYASHRNTFWAAIASEYGHNAAPSTLERAWKSGRCCGGQQQQQGHSPLTPSASPLSETREGFGDRGRNSLSAILGPDAGGRSAWDRDMIRKMEVN